MDGDSQRPDADAGNTGPQDGDINPAPPAAAGSTTSLLDLTTAENIGDSRGDNTNHAPYRIQGQATRSVPSDQNDPHVQVITNLLSENPSRNHITASSSKRRRRAERFNRNLSRDPRWTAHSTGKTARLPDPPTRPVSSSSKKSLSEKRQIFWPNTPYQTPRRHVCSKKKHIGKLSSLVYCSYPPNLPMDSQEQIKKKEMTTSRPSNGDILSMMFHRPPSTSRKPDQTSDNVFATSGSHLLTVDTSSTGKPTQTNNNISATLGSQLSTGDTDSPRKPAQTSDRVSATPDSQLSTVDTSSSRKPVQTSDTVSATPGSLVSTIDTFSSKRPAQTYDYNSTTRGSLISTVDTSTTITDYKQSMTDKPSTSVDVTHKEDRKGQKRKRSSLDEDSNAPKNQDENHNDAQNGFRENQQERIPHQSSKRMRKSEHSRQSNQPSTSRAEINIHDGALDKKSDRPPASRRHDPRKSRNIPSVVNDKLCGCRYTVRERIAHAARRKRKQRQLERDLDQTKDLRRYTQIKMAMKRSRELMKEEQENRDEENQVKRRKL